MAAYTLKRPRCAPHWTLAQRLAHYSDRSGGPDACWPWMGSLNPDGYGFLQWERRRKGVHRLAWEEANGPIPAGMHICHKCDNPPCCNPAHLWLGTMRDNIVDMVRKGRGNRVKGECHGRAKVTEDDVRAIRAAEGTKAAIAKRFGVSESIVSDIHNGRSWAWLL